MGNQKHKLSQGDYEKAGMREVKQSDLRSRLQGDRGAHGQEFC